MGSNPNGAPFVTLARRRCLKVQPPGSTMNATERIKQHHGGPHTDAARPQRPYWKRVHHSAFFWVAAFFILLAMTVFVMTDGFLLRPLGAPAPVQDAARH